MSGLLDTVLKMLLGHVVRSSLHKNGSKHPMLQISMADNMISYKTIKRDIQKPKSLILLYRSAPELRNDQKSPKNGSLNRDLLNFLYRYGIFWMPPGESSHPGGSEYV